MFPASRRPLEHARDLSNGVYPVRTLAANSSVTVADETMYRVSGGDGDGNQTLATVLGTTDAAGPLLFALSGETDNVNSNNKTAPQLWSEWDYVMNTSTATALDPVYLGDTGLPSLTAGTIPRIIGYVLYSATAANKGVARLCPERAGRIWPSVFSIQANSTAVTGATASAAAWPAFNKSISIPARCLHNGSVIRVSGHVKATGQNGTDTGQFRLKFASDVILTGEAIDYVANDYWRFTADIHIRGAIGATQAYTASAEGQWSTAAAVHTVSSLTDTADATAAVTITVEADFGSSSASNTARLEMLNAEIRRPLY